MRMSPKTAIVFAVLEAAIMMQGCKRAPAPATQPVVRSVPKAPQPDIPAPLPIEGDYQSVNPRQPSPRQRAPVIQMHDQTADFQAAEAAQRRQQDARLLQQQRAASRQQQTELNDQVKQLTTQQQQTQDEPRIQDAPEPPASSGLGPDAPRIQDAPGVYQGQDGPGAPRIQDAPGPAQTQPAQPQPPPQS